MATPRLKRSKSSEQRKVTLAIKYREQGSATGGGRTKQPKKARRALEARNIPLAKPRSKAGVKQRAGRRRAT